MRDYVIIWHVLRVIGRIRISTKVIYLFTKVNRYNMRMFISLRAIQMFVHFSKLNTQVRMKKIGYEMSCIINIFYAMEIKVWMHKLHLKQPKVYTF